MEVEIKIPLEGSQVSELETKLAHLGVRLGDPQIQRDVYFTKEPGLYMIRVRQSEVGSMITMKLDTDQEGIWKEIETGIGNGEIGERIIRSAGAEYVATVEKSRRSGRIGRIDVLLDDVIGLGLYLEVAIETEDHTTEAQEELFRFLDSLGMDRRKTELRGYPRMLVERNGPASETKSPASNGLTCQGSLEGGNSE